jgi:hypothetical protein
VLENAEIVHATIRVNDGPLQLVVPVTGELLDLEDADKCVQVLTEIRELESQLREAKATLTEALAAEFARRGTKTMEVGGTKAVLSGGSEIVWDVEVLGELRDLGLPEERMDELVTTEVTYRVNANVAKAIAAANAGYAEVVERAKSVIPKAVYVSLKRG